MREGCCNNQRKEEPQGRERGTPEIEGERETWSRERSETQRERESGECVWEK
jgi:hypothetical protein